MRHLRSILYALILAPAAWILCGVGFDQDLTGRARDNGGIESVGGLLLLLLAGSAYAILLFAPISPAGPLAAGLGFLAVGAWARISPSSYAGVWPAEVTKDGFNISTPGYGLAVLLALPLICTALSARRWAGYEPPQVVLIGTLGRARGAAMAPGTPMAAERTTVFSAAPAVPHQRPPVDDEEKTTLLAALFPVPAEEPTRDVAASEEPTRDVAASEERTTVLPPVEVAGDRTQVLAVGAPSSGERPNPAEDPTTRLPAAKVPGEETTRATNTSTVANLERPADEAADDTRPLSLPAARPSSDDEPTTRL